MARGPSPKFSTSPLLWLAVCFALGTLVQHFLSLPAEYSIGIAVVCGLGAVVLRSDRGALLLIPATFLGAGATSYSLETASVRDDRVKQIYDKGIVLSGSPVEIEGTLTRSPDPSPEGEVLLLAADSLRYRGQEMSVSGSVRLLLIRKAGNDSVVGKEDEGLPLRYGSRIRVACTLEREDEYLNPGVITRREMLHRMGVDATAVVKSSLMIEHLADESVFIPFGLIFDLRSKLIKAFERGLSRSAAGVMTASLLGNRHFLDKPTAETFREGGTFHILVISGLHITFIGGLMLALVRWMTRSRWAQFLITSGTLWSYTLAVGAETPVVRAALMFTAVLYAYAAYRRSAVLNILGLCALALLAWQPSSILDPSFQLTFLSVISIAAIGFPIIDRLRTIGRWMPSPAQPFPPSVPESIRRLCETLYWREAAWSLESQRHIWTAGIFKRPYLNKYLGGMAQKGVQWLFEGLLVSLIVQLCMLPLSVIYFHRFSASSVVLNLWVGVWIAVESFLAILGAICSLFADRLALPFFLLADAANTALLSLPQLLGGSAVRVPEYPQFGKAFYLLHYIPLLLIAAALTRWRPFDVRQSWTVSYRIIVAASLATSILITGIIIYHPWSRPAPDGRLHVEFLDVGQGDAAFVTFPDGQTMLVDGGGKLDFSGPGVEGNQDEVFVRDVRGIGESVVSEVLWEKGYSGVDLVVATHADADHMQGLVDVVRNFSINDAVVGGVPHNEREFTEFGAMLEKRQVPLRTLRSGDGFTISGVSVEVLHPQGGAPDKSDNDHSLVLLLKCGNRSILLTGDIEKAAEGQLVTAGLLRQVDVVKVAHHGSRTSSTSEFIRKTRPAIAVVSVGRRSPFGHPHPEVVDRWKAVNSNVLTTGENGMITVSTDGEDLILKRSMDQK